MLKVIKTIDVRPKSALSTSWDHAKASPIADTVTEDANQDFTSSGGGADREMMGRLFTATASAKLKSVALILGRTGTPAGTILVQLYTDAGGHPGVPLGGVTDAVTASGLSAAAGGASQTFTWTSDLPDVVSGTDYWVIMYTSGYTYANGVTEIRWRTDANGAVGLNECYKLEEPRWSTIGADVGAALTVTYSTVVLPVGDAAYLRLLVDFTKGDSAGLRVKLEFSDDNSTWYEKPNVSIADNIITLTDNAQWHIGDTGYEEIEVGRVMSQYARVSVAALTDATSAECGVKAQIR